MKKKYRSLQVFFGLHTVFETGLPHTLMPIQKSTHCYSCRRIWHFHVSRRVIVQWMVPSHTARSTKTDTFLPNKSKSISYKTMEFWLNLCSFSFALACTRPPTPFNLNAFGPTQNWIKLLYQPVKLSSQQSSHFYVCH